MQTPLSGVGGCLPFWLHCTGAPVAKGAGCNQSSCALPLSAGNLLCIHPQALARALAVSVWLSRMPGIKATRGL